MKPAVLALLALLPGVALAQEDKPEVIIKPVTEIEFPEVDVEGELVRPVGIVVNERSRPTFPPMIVLRTDFNAEIAQSPDELR